MATAQTALRMMREVYLSLPETVEAEHFGEVCFRVGKRIFASCGEKAGVCRLVFQLEPERACSSLPIPGSRRMRGSGTASGRTLLAWRTGTRCGRSSRRATG